MFPLSSFATSKPEQRAAIEGFETLHIQLESGKLCFPRNFVLQGKEKSLKDDGNRYRINSGCHMTGRPLENCIAMYWLGDQHCGQARVLFLSL